MLKQNSFFEAFRDRHPGTLGPLRFMEFEHLRDPELRAFSSQFAGLARNLLAQLPDDPELTKALDALRTVKDRAVGLYAHLKQEGKLPGTHAVDGVTERPAKSPIVDPAVQLMTEAQHDQGAFVRHIA